MVFAAVFRSFLSLFLVSNLNLFVFVFVYVYVYVFLDGVDQSTRIYIWLSREREREKETNNLNRTICKAFDSYPCGVSLVNFCVLCVSSISAKSNNQNSRFLNCTEIEFPLTNIIDFGFFWILAAEITIMNGLLFFSGSMRMIWKKTERNEEETKRRLKTMERKR